MLQIVDPSTQSLNEKTFPCVDPNELPEYKGILEAMNEHDIERCFLFGSAARGERRKDSDIDLFIVINGGDLLWKLWSFETSLSKKYPGTKFDVTTTLVPFVFEKAVSDFKEFQKAKKQIP